MEQLILWLVVVPIGYVVWDFIRRKRMAPTCRNCRKSGQGVVLAMPIAGTQNRYECPTCHHQFAAARHDM